MGVIVTVTRGSDHVTVVDLTPGREKVRLTYATFPLWVKGRAPSFHAKGVSAKTQELKSSSLGWARVKAWARGTKKRTQTGR